MDGSTTDLFINLIQNHPIIYDKSSKDFKNTRKKEEAWANIAHQSRMHVDAAKKRYFSLRQKYCREKRNSELRRRNKLATRKNWVLYDRLHFLDAFIQPRATFTNDTGFEEDFDPEAMDEEQTEYFDAACIDVSQNIHIEVDESVNANDLDCLIEHDQDVTEQVTGQHEENWNNNVRVEEVQSEYTGQVSQILYFTNNAENDASSRNGELVDAGSTTVETEEEHHQVEEQFDLNYVSKYPGTSSSHISAVSLNPSNQQFAPQLYTCSADKGSSNCRGISTTKINRPMISTPGIDLSGTFPSSQNHSSSRRDTTAPTNTTLRQTTPTPKNTVPLRQNSARANRTLVTPSTASTQKSAPPCTDTTTSASNEKSIEMIRHKMNSCLTAIQNKVTDKAHRSPHAPFLAYLGTKLTSVPKEIISNVEEEILEIVKKYSK